MRVTWSQTSASSVVGFIGKDSVIPPRWSSTDTPSGGAAWVKSTRLTAKEEWGQRVVAVVQLASGFNDDEDLRAKLDQHVREQIAGFNRPREYIFVVDFPRSAAGKVSRQKLRELANGQ